MRIHIAGIIVCLSLIPVLITPSAFANEGSCANPDKDLAIANKLFSEKRYWEAEAVYRQLLESDETGDAHLGLFYSRDCQSGANSLQDTESAVKILYWRFPNKPKSLAAGGYLAFRIGCKTKTITEHLRYMFVSETLCKQAIKKNPELLQPIIILSLVRADLYEYRSSTKYFNEAVNLALKYSNKPWVDKHESNDQMKQLKHHCNIARIALCFKDLNLAEREFKKILNLLGVSQEFYPILHRDALL